MEDSDVDKNIVNVKMEDLIVKTKYKVFNFIKEFIGEKGYSPTVRQIGKGVGLNSSSTVHAHLNNLRKEGLIDWEEGLVRTIRLIQKEKAS